MIARSKWSGSCLAIICAFSTGCGDPPHEVVERFVESYNQKDINGCISCLDPMVEKAYGATSRIASVFIGVEFTDVFDLMPALIPAMQAHTGDPSDVRLSGRHLSTTVKGDRAIAIFEMTTIAIDNTGTATSTTEILHFPLKEYDGEWRISIIEAATAETWLRGGGGAW